MERCPKCAGDNLKCNRCNGLGVIDIPTTIYLQTDYLDEVTWCIDRINPTDIKYILSSDNDTIECECLCNAAGDDNDLYHESWCPASRK